MPAVTTISSAFYFHFFFSLFQPTRRRFRLSSRNPRFFPRPFCSAFFSRIFILYFFFQRQSSLAWKVPASCVNIRTPRSFQRKSESAIFSSLRCCCVVAVDFFIFCAYSSGMCICVQVIFLCRFTWFLHYNKRKFSYILVIDNVWWFVTKILLFFYPRFVWKEYKNVIFCPKNNHTIYSLELQWNVRNSSME